MIKYMSGFKKIESKIIFKICHIRRKLETGNWIIFQQIRETNSIAVFVWISVLIILFLKSFGLELYTSTFLINICFFTSNEKDELNEHSSVNIVTPCFKVISHSNFLLFLSKISQSIFLEWRLCLFHFH